MDVFGTRPEANKAGGKLAKPRDTIQKAQKQGWSGLSATPQAG